MTVGVMLRCILYLFPIQDYINNNNDDNDDFC